MKNTIIYHGSNVEVSNPKILINGYYKDFGYGFYCTNIEKQAKRWALTKKGASYREAGCFAAAMCTIKLQTHGPFCGTEAEIRRIINPA